MTAVLTHSPAKIVQNLLADLGDGTLRSENSSGTWPIFRGKMLNTPDNCIVVSDTESKFDGWNQIDGEADEHFGIQILVRGAKESTADNKVRAITGTLDKTVRNNTVTISSSVYTVTAITRTSGPIHIGAEEESERHLYSVNAVVALRQTT